MELARVIENLERVRRECAVKDWDGHNAEPVSEKSYSTAMRFARLIPTEFPSPDVDATPTGKILFEWDEDGGKVFDVSIGDGILFYAVKIGAEKFKRSVHLPEEIPSEILDLLKRFYS